MVVCFIVLSGNNLSSIINIFRNIGGTFYFLVLNNFILADIGMISLWLTGLHALPVAHINRSPVRETYLM